MRNAVKYVCLSRIESRRFGVLLLVDESKIGFDVWIKW